LLLDFILPLLLVSIELIGRAFYINIYKNIAYNNISLENVRT